MNTDTILIVDDTPTNLEVLANGLQLAGYRVATSKHGQDALDKAQHVKFDLILLDVMMPTLDGFAVCAQLKANPFTQDIPVIFMTAVSELDSKVKGFELGAVDYITKPIQLAEVLSRVKLHLRLKHTQEELKQALCDVQQAQMSLIQQERMASLGQLVAGIAHEINNPVNFIYGNLKPAGEYIQSLIELVELYQCRYPHPTPDIQEKESEIDLEFLVQDLLKLFQSMEIGAERIRDIVLSLQSFSRVDQSGIKDTDIHAGLESTLLILGQKLRKATQSEITLLKHYGSLPPIQCHPGKLNQVFLNILSNAIDALTDPAAPPTAPAQIEIKTGCLDEHSIFIEISNNGSEIPASVQSRLFDPFFTTKPIGRGTGLGLSISHKIITQEHRGRLTCRSSAEKTTFRIELPCDTPTNIKAIDP